VHTQFDMPGWPAGVPVPRRLTELLTFLHAPGASPLFGDFEVQSLADDPLIKLTDKDDTPIFSQFPPVFGFFARDGSGGELAIWLRSENPSDCPVVWFSSEGERTVLGENLDDFLCLLAGHWRDASHADMQADEMFASWVRQIGLLPHPNSESRLESLNLRTLEFRRWLAEERRAIEHRLYPERAQLIEVHPGEKMGAVRLGASESQVSALLGTPRLPHRPDDWPTIDAFYEGHPYSVTYDRGSRTAIRILVSIDRVVVRFPDGFQPFFATHQEARRWLDARAVAYQRTPRSLDAPSFGLTMNLSHGYGVIEREIQTTWVESVSIAVPRRDG
jgi:hypothetical protein